MGIESERAAWNETYVEAVNFDQRPNRLLMDMVRGRTPGTALDVGMGQGRNAIFLASEGWQVTGVDISEEGVNQALAAAKAAGLELQGVVGDLETWGWGEERYDLIALIYMGTRPPVDRIRRALKTGGIVVIEFFRVDATLGTGVGGFEPGALPRLFAEGFEIMRHDEVMTWPTGVWSACLSCASSPGNADIAGASARPRLMLFCDHQQGRGRGPRRTFGPSPTPTPSAQTLLTPPQAAEGDLDSRSAGAGR